MFKAKNGLILSLLIAALLLPGCGHKTVPESSANASEITSDSAQENASFTFDNHAYPGILKACRPNEFCESFYNLCDALCEGKDTFICSSHEAYDFCMDEETLNELYPVACYQISKGDKGFENGTGHIKYVKSKDDFLKRQERFQKDISDIINKWIRPDYSDFEKCLVLFDYMTAEYQYDHLAEVGKFDGGAVYACFELKKGICCDIGGLYAYLLMQCGVDAIAVENQGTITSAGYHAWTYVRIGEDNYHIDVTSALRAETGFDGVPMDYFMMTDNDRSITGSYPLEELEVPLIPCRFAKICKEYEFTAVNPKYRLPEWSVMTRYDTYLDIIYYAEEDRVMEFYYG